MAQTRSSTCVAVPPENVPGDASHTLNPPTKRLLLICTYRVWHHSRPGGATICHRSGCMEIVPATQTTFAFRPDAEPVLRVRPGEVVRFETSPEPVERLLAAGARWTEAIDVRAFNAV